SVTDENGAIVVLDPAAHGIGDANACGDASHDAGGHAQVAKNRVELRVREASEPLLGDQVLALTGLQLVDDLGTPRSLDAVRAVSRTWLQAQPPVGKGGVRIVRFQDVGDIHYGPPCDPKAVG